MQEADQTKSMTEVALIRHLATQNSRRDWYPIACDPVFVPKVKSWAQANGTQVSITGNAKERAYVVNLSGVESLNTWKTTVATEVAKRTNPSGSIHMQQFATTGIIDIEVDKKKFLNIVDRLAELAKKHQFSIPGLGDKLRKMTSVLTPLGRKWGVTEGHAPPGIGYSE